LEKNARKIINLLHRGVRFTPTQPDIIKIERFMLGELQGLEGSEEGMPVEIQQRDFAP
jgi:hypothetical protein